MKHGIRTAIACVGLAAWAGLSLAQHQGHQMGTGSAGGDPCLEHAKEGLRIVERADRQLEEARQTNSPQEMRAAMNDLQAALGEVRTQLSLCASPATGNPVSSMEGMEGMDHSGMKDMDPAAMEGMQGMDHGTAAPGTKDSKPPQGSVRPGDSKGTDHSQMDMDHSKMSMPGMNTPARKGEPTSVPPGGKQMSQVSPQATKDPICFKEADTQGAEKATYKGKTYYFCSRVDRERFLSDPAAYVNH